LQPKHSRFTIKSPLAPVGVALKMGWLRTIAAVHHQMNQAVATPLTLHMECKNVVACDSSEINLLPVLGVRCAPNLDAIPMMPADHKRRSARVILLSAAQQVLLIRFVAERQDKPFVFWATPGGGVENGETVLEAARRELDEELALDIALTGPVHTVSSTFEHEGKPLKNIDVFFLGYHEPQGVALHFKSEAERAAMKEIRWWTITELERSSETIFPPDLPRLLRSLSPVPPLPRDEPSPVGAQVLDLPASFNFRDLGGLPTRHGLTVKAGRLYRSGDPSQLDPADTRSLAAISLRSVVDLRTSLELQERGVGLAGPSSAHLHRPLFERIRPNWISPTDQSPDATAKRYLEMLSDGTQTFVNTVIALSEHDAYPLAIHCAAGRDRTGIVVACVLDLIDVEDSAIASDYALSDGAVHDGSRAHPQTMLHFLTGIREQYGSTRELLSAHGVPGEVFDQLRRNLVSTN
jgi:8-oxo-dGTP diphosphatase